MPFKLALLQWCFHHRLKDEETQVLKGPHRKPRAELGSNPVVCLLAVLLLMNLLPVRTLSGQGPETLLKSESFYKSMTQGPQIPLKLLLFRSFLL